ncbi:MAG: hypothetical protein GY730_00580 [bacterium]|nr:hypothetical protein [bacterium]
MTNKYLSFFIFFIKILLAANLSAQQFGGLSDLDIYRQSKNSNTNYRQMPPEKILEKTEAHFIKEMFLKTIFQMNKTTMGSDENDQFFAANSELVNEFLMDELAKDLAEQDILGFKKAFLKRYKNRESAK